MRSTQTPRCPSCGHPALRQNGQQPLPGMLLVCAGCLVPSRFDDGGERLVGLEPGDLPPELREKVMETQRELRRKLGPSGRPPGYRWRTLPLCQPCWEDFEPGRPPVVVTPRRLVWEPCAFCKTLTQSGITRRLLVKDPEPSGLGEEAVN